MNNYNRTYLYKYASEHDVAALEYSPYNKWEGNSIHNIFGFKSRSCKHTGQIKI